MQARFLPWAINLSSTQPYRGRLHARYVPAVVRVLVAVPSCRGAGGYGKETSLLFGFRDRLDDAEYRWRTHPPTRLRWRPENIFRFREERRQQRSFHPVVR